MEITILETRELLQRLVRERKALERGLEAAEMLANVEALLPERQSALAKLQEQCAAKEQELIALDENVSELHQKREAACAQREREVEIRVSKLKELAEDLESHIAALRADLKTTQEQHMIAFVAAKDARDKELAGLDAQILERRAELAAIQQAARSLAGV